MAGFGAACRGWVCRVAEDDVVSGAGRGALQIVVVGEASGGHAITTADFGAGVRAVFVAVAVDLRGRLGARHLAGAALEPVGATRELRTTRVGRATR